MTVTTQNYTSAKRSIGKIHQVLGAVVDVKFASEKELPDILTALECDNHGHRTV